MNYKLKVLSPLHIGCGEEYNGLSYLMDPRKKPPQISILNEDLIFGMFKDGQIKSFVTWLENERFPNLFYFFKNVLKDNNFSLQNQLRQKAIYTIPSYAGQEKLKNINSFIKQMQHPYIPGTEIKGAIRTAVLYCSLRDQRKLNEWLVNSIKDFGSKFNIEIDLVKNKKNLGEKNPNNERESLGNIKKKLEDEMSKITKELQERTLNTNAKDAKFDIMKYVQVGDSELLDAGKYLTVSYVKPFNISKEPSIFYEYIKPDTEISLSTLTLESTKSLKGKLDHMGFDDNQKNIVSGMDQILKYCYRFSNDLLDEEISFFNNQDNIKFKSPEGKQRILNHLNEIKSLNKSESPVLRIGKDEGYNSLTVGLAVKKLDNDLYENVLIHATKNKSYDSEHGGPLPKSRKIVYWNGVETTAGWVKLIPEIDSASQQASEKNPADQKVQAHQPAPPADLSMLASKFKVGIKK